ncbi:DUF1302 family protein [Nisaea sp.]|uniref:DUF1302 family protein n=1 Tax=Nisaea sp. TaxID=2024842 RepID=UPI0032EFB2ED
MIFRDLAALACSGALLTCSVSMHAARADDALELSGEARAGYWSSDRALTGDDHVPAVGLWLKGDFRYDEDWSARFEGIVSDTPVRADGPDADIRRAYIRWGGSADWDVRAGRQIVAWGRSDFLAPTDNLGSWDYTALHADDNDQRQGAFMVRAVRWIEDYRFEAVWLPERRPNVYPLPQTLRTVVDPETGSQWRGDQFAVKLDEYGREVDWSVSWFHGMDRTFSLTPDTAPESGKAFESLYPMVDVVGLDAATTLGEVGLRGEIAYTHVGDAAETNLVRRSQLQLQIGTELRPFSGVTMNLSYLGRYVTDFRDPGSLSPPLDQLAVAMQALWFQQDRYQNGGAIRLATSALNDTLKAELSTLFLTPTGEGTTRVKATYLVSDNFKIIGGINWFWGPETSYFGSISETSGAYFEARYTF